MYVHPASLMNTVSPSTLSGPLGCVESNPNSHSQARGTRGSHPAHSEQRPGQLCNGTF